MLLAPEVLCRLAPQHSMDAVKQDGAGPKTQKFHEIPHLSWNLMIVTDSSDNSEFQIVFFFNVGIIQLRMGAIALPGHPSIFPSKPTIFSIC